MRIGIHMGFSTVDNVVEECRTVGVNEIFLSATSVPGYDEVGYSKSDQLRKITDGLQDRKVLVSGIIIPPPSPENVLGQDDTERKGLLETIRAAGKSGIHTSLFYPLDRFLHFHEYHVDRPLKVMPGDDDWPAIEEFMRDIVDS